MVPQYTGTRKYRTSLKKLDRDWCFSKDKRFTSLALAHKAIVDYNLKLKTFIFKLTLKKRKFSVKFDIFASFI